MSNDIELQRQINALQRDIERSRVVDSRRVMGARIYHNAAQSIANDTATALAFNSERYDTDTFHDNTTNNSRLTILYPGRYLITATIEFDANATGYRQANVRTDGANNISVVRLPAVGGGIPTNLNISAVANAAAGAYIEIVVRQTSGGALNVASAAYYTPEVVITYLGAYIT